MNFNNIGQIRTYSQDGLLLDCDFQTVRFPPGSLEVVMGGCDLEFGQVFGRLAHLSFYPREISSDEMDDFFCRSVNVLPGAAWTPNDPSQFVKERPFPENETIISLMLNKFMIRKLLKSLNFMNDRERMYLILHVLKLFM
jgi:hypothetical protein